MMQVFWTGHAKRRRREIFVHIAADSLNAAIVLDSKFQSLSVRLPQIPNSGRLQARYRRTALRPS